MIAFVKGGVLLTDEGWAGSFPRPDTNTKHSSIDVMFNDGVRLEVTEDFLRHALHMIEFERNRKGPPSLLLKCLAENPT